MGGHAPKSENVVVRLSHQRFRNPNSTPSSTVPYSPNAELRSLHSRVCAACASPGRTKASRHARAQMRATTNQPKNDAEREGYEAIYAYEEALSNQKGRNTRAGRTWPMAEEHGIIGAIERIVTRRVETEGYRILVEVGMEDMIFKAVVLRHPDSFSAAAVAASQESLER